jgi:sugar/nucleoside kinase (ribokinase family)
MGEHPQYILVIGSAYKEHILQLDNEMLPGEKNIIECHDLLGGSGIDYTLRLINAGFLTIPILSVGNDKLGHEIRNEIISSAKMAKLPSQIIEFVDSRDFFVVNTTSRSFILVEKEKRTTLIERARRDAQFNDYVLRRLEYLFTKPDISINAVMIGHINSDSPDVNPSKPGECTKYIIQKFYNKCFIIGNFGNSQLSMGADFWEDDIKHLSVFQLNLNEARRFFSQKKDKMSIINIIEWFKERDITVVITLDRFGAIGNYRNGEDGVIFAWPHEIADFTDSTGAGDAFGAGLVSILCHKKDFSLTDFLRAISEAMLWASYACTTLGGASSCPDRRTLEAFRKNISVQDPPSLEIHKMESARRILQLLDKVT